MAFTDISQEEALGASKYSGTLVIPRAAGRRLGGHTFLYSFENYIDV
jgi:hypothetical protein